MASADFWPITIHVAAHSASDAVLGFGGQSSPFDLGLSPTSMTATDALLGQISPDKVRELSLHNRAIYPIS